MGLLLNRAKANTSTTGTGAVTPGGAVTPFQTWSAAGAASGYWYDYLIEDGANWEMGVGFYNGTTITRPGPGVDPWFTSSTAALLNLTGSATIACVANKDTLAAGVSFMPPLASSFTLASGDANNVILANDTSVGLTVDANTPVATDEVRIATRTLTDKTLDWEHVTKQVGYLTATGTSAFGVALYDSVSGRLQSVVLRAPTSPFVVMYNWTTLSTFSSSPASLANPIFFSDLWYRVRHTGGNYVYDISYDGKVWVNVYSAGATSFLTNRADRVGIYTSYNRSTGPNNKFSVPYFTLTGPGV